MTACDRMILLVAGFLVCCLNRTTLAGPAENNVPAVPAAAPDDSRPPAVPPDAVDILNGKSMWRFYVSYRPPIVPPGEDGSGGGVLQVGVMPYRRYPGLEKTETSPPGGRGPADWTQTDFDDGDWGRGPGVIGTLSEYQPGTPDGSIGQALNSPGLKYCLGVIYLRGRFAATDPAAAGLYLSLGYRGGAVVYLNGRRVAIRDLPAAAADPLSVAPADPYPDETYLDSAGNVIPQPFRINRNDKDLAARLARRDRSLLVRLPSEALRKGVNVLAIAIHRSDYNAAALRPRWLEAAAGGSWVPCTMLNVRLAAAGQGAGVLPNVARPGGIQVWNQDANDRVLTGSYGDPNEPLRPIRLVGARNGCFSGQVVVSSPNPIKGLKAVAGDLAGPDASGAAPTGRPPGAPRHVIPASNVWVRLARLDAGAPPDKQNRESWFDGLPDWPAGPTTQADVPVVKGAAIQPVWITVRVPKDAPPGEYRGTVTLSAGGQPGQEGLTEVAVPVQLSVADWTVPDPADFRAYVGLYQSPTTVALQYKVKEWSQEHWRLLARSFRLLGRVGNRYLCIPICEHSQFGNDEGMLYFIENPDGSYDYDFTVFDRYVGLAKAHLPVQDYVVLQVWHAAGWAAKPADQEAKVTVVDRATGEHRHVQVPVFGTEESKRFWRPVLAACQQHLAKVGMDKAMCLGMFSDGCASAEVIMAFDEIWPGGGPARWTRMRHNNPAPVTPGGYPLPLQAASPETRLPSPKLGGRVVLHEFCLGPSAPDPDVKVLEFWDPKLRANPNVQFLRHDGDDQASMLKLRTFQERLLYTGLKGIGRVGLDFWRDTFATAESGAGIFGRWPISNGAQRSPAMFHLSCPGPEGAAATVRFEALLEGLQAAEAVLIVAEAQGDKDRAARIGPELAEQCREFLVERIKYVRTGLSAVFGRPILLTVHQGWQDMDRRLFELAGKVQAG